MVVSEIIINKVKEAIHKELLSQLAQLTVVDISQLACPSDSDEIQGHFRVSSSKNEDDVDLQESLETQGVLEPLLAIKNYPTRPHSLLIVNGVRRFRLMIKNPKSYSSIPIRIIDYQQLESAVISSLGESEAQNYFSNLVLSRKCDLIIESLKAIFLSTHQYLHRVTDEDYFHYFIYFKKNHSLKSEKLAFALRSLGKKRANSEYHNLSRIWKVASSEIGQKLFFENYLPLSILKKDFSTKLLEDQEKAERLYQILEIRFEAAKEKCPINKINCTPLELLEIDEIESVIKEIGDCALTLSDSELEARTLKRKKTKVKEGVIQIPAITLNLSSKERESQSATLHTYFQLIKAAAEIHSSVLGAGSSLDLMDVVAHGVDKIYCRTIILTNKVDCADFYLMDNFFKTCPKTLEAYALLKKQVAQDYDQGKYQMGRYDGQKRTSVVNEVSVRRFIENHRKIILDSLES